MKQLIVILKNPVLGKAKTRLAVSIGDEKALEVYRLLCEHTLRVAELADCDVTLFFSDHNEEAIGSVSLDGFRQKIQEGNGLGARMKNAFKEVKAKGASSVVIIGSDCPLINPEILHQAFAHLALSDFVIGPATDGGFYLMGMNELHDELFLNTYSHSEVRKETLSAADHIGLASSVMQELSDLDTVEDLEGFCALNPALKISIAFRQVLQD